MTPPVEGQPPPQPGDSARNLGYRDLVLSDLRRLRPGARESWIGVVLRLPSVPGLLASVILRGQQVLYRSGRERLAGRLTTLGNVTVGADFGPHLHIGTGLVLMHPVGVVIGAGSRIGDDVTFASGVVLAARYYDDDHDGEQSFPVVGNGVTLGAHSVLRGGVHIGDGAVVGANSVVLDDVPAHTVVAGSPARPVGTRSPKET